jgi:hypothetical protein
MTVLRSSSSDWRSSSAWHARRARARAPGAVTARNFRVEHVHLSLNFFDSFRTHFKKRAAIHLFRHPRRRRIAQARDRVQHLVDAFVDLRALPVVVVSLICFTCPSAPTSTRVDSDPLADLVQGAAANDP